MTTAWSLLIDARDQLIRDANSDKTSVSFHTLTHAERLFIFIDDLASRPIRSVIANFGE